MSAGSPFHSMYSVTGNVVTGHEGGGQLVNGQILLFFHLQGKTRWSGETECYFPWLCFRQELRYAMSSLIRSSSCISLTYPTYLICGNRFTITLHLLSQTQLPCSTHKILHSGAAFSGASCNSPSMMSYIHVLWSLLRSCPTCFPAPLWPLIDWCLPCLSLFVDFMMLYVMTMTILENWDFPPGKGVWGVLSGGFLGDFPTPVPAVEKQVVLLCFLHILSLFNLTSAFPVL